MDLTHSTFVSFCLSTFAKVDIHLIGLLYFDCLQLLAEILRLSSVILRVKSEKLFASFNIIFAVVRLLMEISTTLSINQSRKLQYSFFPQTSFVVRLTMEGNYPSDVAIFDLIELKIIKKSKFRVEKKIKLVGYFFML